MIEQEDMRTTVNLCLVLVMVCSGYIAGAEKELHYIKLGPGNALDKENEISLDKRLVSFALKHIILDGKGIGKLINVPFQ